MAVSVAAVLASTGAATGAAAAVPVAGPAHDADHFAQTNLVSDIPGLAPLLDPDVKNPWGLALGPDTPLWVNNNFSTTGFRTKVTLYQGATGRGVPFVKVPVEVGASSPFGIVFNPTDGFTVRQGGAPRPARFLFNEAAPGPGGAPIGELSGWAPAPVLPRNTEVHVRQPGALYLGLALVKGPRLLAADTIGGRIDVFDRNFHKLDLSGAFVDPHPAGLTPYNVMTLKGRVYVSYSPAGGPGTGPSALSVFAQDGRFIKRLATGGVLQDPWGMAIAPPEWGDHGGDLLVGNVDDGRINTFDPQTGAFHGPLRDQKGAPIVNLGLWGLQFGNGVAGTPRTLLFAAGIGKVPGGFEEFYEHGLVGMIKPVDD